MKTIVTSALLALSISAGVYSAAVGGIEEAFGTRTSPLQGPSPQLTAIRSRLRFGERSNRPTGRAFSRTSRATPAPSQVAAAHAKNRPIWKRAYLFVSALLALPNNRKPRRSAQMRKLLLVSLVAAAPLLALGATPASACGGYGYGYGAYGYSYYRPAFYRPAFSYRSYYRPRFAYSGFYRPRVWGWRGWGGRGFGWRGGRRW